MFPQTWRCSFSGIQSWIGELLRQLNDEPGETDSLGREMDSNHRSPAGHRSRRGTKRRDAGRASRNDGVPLRRKHDLN